ncbi:MAG: hypothetical protein ACLTZH_08575 [Subdoligranulum sp.]
MATDTKLDSLVINYLTQAQYDNAKSEGTLNSNQIYMTPASSGTHTAACRYQFNPGWRKDWRAILQ